MTSHHHHHEPVSTTTTSGATTSWWWYRWWYDHLLLVLGLCVLLLAMAGYDRVLWDEQIPAYIHAHKTLRRECGDDHRSSHGGDCRRILDFINPYGDEAWRFWLLGLRKVPLLCLLSEWAHDERFVHIGGELLGHGLCHRLPVFDYIASVTTALKRGRLCTLPDFFGGASVVDVCMLAAWYALIYRCGICRGTYYFVLFAAAPVMLSLVRLTNEAGQLSTSTINAGGAVLSLANRVTGWIGTGWAWIGTGWTWLSG